MRYLKKHIKAEILSFSWYYDFSRLGRFERKNYTPSPHKGDFNVSSLSTREGNDGSSNAPRRWYYSDKSEEERANLLQEDHLN